MTYIKDVVCCPENHLVLLIALAVIAPGIAFVVEDASWDEWRNVRPLRALASFYAGLLIMVAGAWRTVLGAGVVVGVAYLLLVARARWCEKGGRCATILAAPIRPKASTETRAWHPDPCDWAFRREERQGCLEEKEESR